MTIHAAKGLAVPDHDRVGHVDGGHGRPGLPAEVVFRPGRRARVPVREQGRHRRVRRVDPDRRADERPRAHPAALRRVHPAQDHLVVSLHRKVRKSMPEPDKRTNAELLRGRHGPAARGGSRRRRRGRTGADDHAVGAAERAAAVRRVGGRAGRRAPHARRGPSTIAATALTDEGGLDADDELADGLEKRPRDMDQPPWLKGRYGSAVGRAVHGVLQTIDLATGDGRGRRGGRAVPGRGHPRPGRRRHQARRLRARLADRAGGGGLAALAGGLRLHAVGRRPPARGLHRPALPHRPTAWSSSTTRPPPRTTGRSSTSGSTGYRLQGASYAIVGRPGHRRAGGAGRVPVPHARAARSRSTWPTSMR